MHHQSFSSFYDADLPQEVDMYHELVPLEPQHNVNKSSIFGYATSVYKVCLTFWYKKSNTILVAEV